MIILSQQPNLGNYLKLEQVFIRKKDTQKLLDELKAQPIARHYTCFYCGLPIKRTTKKCSDCNKDILICIVCKLPISFGEAIGKCTLCEVQGHLSHIQEAVKISGKCPRCLQKLPMEGIVPEDELKGKKSAK